MFLSKQLRVKSSNYCCSFLDQEQYNAQPKYPIKSCDAFGKLALDLHNSETQGNRFHSDSQVLFIVSMRPLIGRMNSAFSAAFRVRPGLQVGYSPISKFHSVTFDTTRISVSVPPSKFSDPYYTVLQLI